MKNMIRMRAIDLKKKKKSFMRGFEEQSPL